MFGFICIYHKFCICVSLLYNPNLVCKQRKIRANALFRYFPIGYTRISLLVSVEYYLKQATFLYGYSWISTQKQYLLHVFSVTVYCNSTIDVRVRAFIATFNTISFSVIDNRKQVT